jgi:hypothetical protein
VIDILRIDDDDVLLSHRDRALSATREHALPNDQGLYLAGLSRALLDRTLLGLAHAYHKGPCQEGDHDHAQHPWRHSIHCVSPFDTEVVRGKPPDACSAPMITPAIIAPAPDTSLLILVSEA